MPWQQQQLNLAVPVLCVSGSTEGALPSTSGSAFDFLTPPSASQIHKTHRDTAPLCHPMPACNILTHPLPQPNAIKPLVLHLFGLHCVFFPMRHRVTKVFKSKVENLYSTCAASGFFDFTTDYMFSVTLKKSHPAKTTSGNQKKKLSVKMYYLLLY